MLTDHRALQPSLKRKRAHKQYSAILTRWLDRLSLFDVNVKYTTDKNNPLKDYLSRHLITDSDESEVDSKTESRVETEVEKKEVRHYSTIQLI